MVRLQPLIARGQPVLSLCAASFGKQGFDLVKLLVQLVIEVSLEGSSLLVGLLRSGRQVLGHVCPVGLGSIELFVRAVPVCSRLLGFLNLLHAFLGPDQA